MILWYALQSLLLALTKMPQILTHSYSRVVTQALLHAHTRKRISVYVTEARPRGLGCVGPTPILISTAHVPVL